MFAPLIFGVKGLLEFTQRGFINASKTFDNSHLYLNLSQKVIIITGANSGLGYSSAKTISKLKATVILVCRNNEAAIKARDQIISDSNNENVFIELCDLSKPASVALLVERIVKKYPTIDVLVLSINLDKQCWCFDQ